MKYLLLDAQNLFHRAKHSTNGDADMKAGMALQIILSSILKCWKMLDVDHLVVALEGRSWRREVFAEYKMHRDVKDKLKSTREIADDKLMQDAMNDFIAFVSENTNCTTLQQMGLEADDFIALWVQEHPTDQHVIVSSDTDFYQLLAPNCSIYNGIKGHHITINGVVDVDGKTVINKKTLAAERFDPEWELFRKCVKGDSSDGIWAAHVPRTRETKIKAAFEDRHTKGYDWNNLMLEEWVDHAGVRETVLARYVRNVELIDLSAQPEIIRDLGKDTMEAATKREPVSAVGVRFMKFCGKHNLVRISEKADQYAKIFAKGLK